MAARADDGRRVHGEFGIIGARSREATAIRNPDRCNAISVSTRALGHGMAEQLHNPCYGSAGVRKFALLAPAGFPDTIEEGGKEVIDERPKETGFWCREVGIDFRPSLGAVFRPTNFFNVARCVERITDTHSEASEFVRR